MAWGCAQYTKDLPYANAAYDYNFKPGASGKLVLEFWITPFDYAGCDGPQRAVESQLTENKLIGLSWCLIDYDDVNAKGRVGFWNLSHKQTFFGNADQLVGFRLMPLEAAAARSCSAWTHKVIDMNRRLVAFTDQSVGRSRLGNGISAMAHVDRTASAARLLARRRLRRDARVSGPEGTSRFQRVWDVSLR